MMKVYAAQPKLSVTATSNTTIVMPSNAGGVAQYRVTNNTKLSRTLTMRPIEGISELGNLEGSCISPFTLASKQSCLLTLRLESALLSESQSPSIVVCKTTSPGNNTPSPFFCSQPSAMDQLNISQYPANETLALVGSYLQNKVTICRINSTSGLLEDCVVNTDPSFNITGGIRVNPTHTMAYITNVAGNSISICKLSTSDRTLSDCSVKTSALFNSPRQIEVDLSFSRMYISNYANSIVVMCDIDQNDGSLTNCQQASPVFQSPIGLAKNSHANKMYVSNYNALPNQINVCQLNQSTGQIEQCDTDSIMAGSKTIQFITINYDNSRIYIANDAGTYLNVCDLNSSTGRLENCRSANYPAAAVVPVQVALNYKNTKAYITTYLSHSVRVCDIDKDGGEFSNCVATGSGFTGPSGITLTN